MRGHLTGLTEKFLRSCSRCRFYTASPGSLAPSSSQSSSAERHRHLEFDKSGTTVMLCAEATTTIAGRKNPPSRERLGQLLGLFPGGARSARILELTLRFSSLAPLVFQRRLDSWGAHVEVVG